MIQFTELLADAYVHPARNIAMPSLPGRQVRFLQGHAIIRDGRDMVAMLRRADVKLVLTRYAMNWYPTWLTAARDVKAEVMLPHSPDPNPDEPKPEDEDKDEEEIPEPEPEPEPVPSARRNTGWNLPRDPKTGRIMSRRHSLSGANSTQSGS